MAHGHVYPQVDGQQIGTEFEQPNVVFRNLGDEHFEELGARAGPALERVQPSRAVLPIDLDNDGDMDFLLTSYNDTPALLRNDGAPGNWLQVRLRGSGGNREGIGAHIELRAGGRAQYRQMRRSTLHLSVDRYRRLRS